MTIPNVLAIGGSDSSGGAGIQADLRTVSALGAWGCTVVTAVTAQNSRTVLDTGVLPAVLVARQLEAVSSDITIAAIKIGMLGDGPVARAVVEGLDRFGGVPIVVDPVVAASTGARLLDDTGLGVLRYELLPRATVVTPNTVEVGYLLDARPPESLAEVIEAAYRLQALGPRHVLVTGGHLASGADCIDLLCDGRRHLELRHPRIDAGPLHGTGCTLASAIAALLAQGVSVPDACRESQRFVARAIGGGTALSVGTGRRPLY